METPRRKPTLQKVPVYEVRLVPGPPLPTPRRTDRLSDAQLAAKTLHAMLGLTDREHFAALFLNGTHKITGAHVIAIGGQHGIGTIEARTVFRAAVSACASGLVLGHNHPSGHPVPSAEEHPRPPRSSWRRARCLASRWSTTSS